ncbi:hypothetical protein ACSDQ9_00520 [Aestuariimicrobium soli]|uniref:hypothetical protein n=1 Tax=Aestuariimicrobium soli TaxID=2035834 RepID=UPI003EB97D23
MTDFEAVLSDLNRLTAQVSDGSLKPSDEQLEALPEVVGTNEDETIKVSIKAGTVTRVELHPKAHRLDNVTLGEQLTEAINAAIQANLEAVMQGNADLGTPDYASLNQQLNDIQTESLRSMQRYTDGMLDMLRKAKEL